MTATGRRTLVAGVGNVFLSDDGFGVEVAHRLLERRMPAGVSVEDFGIRGVHLAYALLDGYDELILIDALSRGEPPGTVFVVEPDLADPAPSASLAAAVGDGDVALVDAHGLAPDSVLALLRTLGGSVGRVRVVGCEPAVLAEGMGLSEPAAGAVDAAVEIVVALVGEAAGDPGTDSESDATANAGHAMKGE